jgi:hypothetical protein
MDPLAARLGCDLGMAVNVVAPVADLVTAETLAAWLRARFPLVTLWYGVHTGHWWALAADRLLGAATTEELVSALTVAYLTRHFAEPTAARAARERQRQTPGNASPDSATCTRVSGRHAADRGVRPRRPYMRRLFGWAFLLAGGSR